MQAHLRVEPDQLGRRARLTLWQGICKCWCSFHKHQPPRVEEAYIIIYDKHRLLLALFVEEILTLAKERARLTLSVLTVPMFERAT